MKVGGKRILGDLPQYFKFFRWMLTLLNRLKLKKNTKFFKANCSYLETQQEADIPWRMLVDKVRQTENFASFLSLVTTIKLKEKFPISI